MRPVNPITRRAASLLAALAVALPLAVSGAPVPQEPAREDVHPRGKAKSAEAGFFEARFTDGSHLKVKLSDEKVELQTPYGKLLIPAADIRRIDFATRVPDDITKKIGAAVANLGSPDFKTREAASAELKALGAPTYPALQKAAKSTDPEVVRRAEELLAKVREEAPEEQLEVRPHDVIYTEHSKIAGRIPAAALKVITTQFGEQPMKLADVRCLSVPGAESEAAPVAVEPGPENMTPYANAVGKTFLFRVTGNVAGSVWGTDVYTGDSSLAAAAVHAGALRSGQTGVVRVTMVAPPPAFAGSTRNGVTSSGYPAFPSAYKVRK
jgi:hypothetical protein